MDLATPPRSAVRVGRLLGAGDRWLGDQITNQMLRHHRRRLRRSAGRTHSTSRWRMGGRRVSGALGERRGRSDRRRAGPSGDRRRAAAGSLARPSGRLVLLARLRARRETAIRSSSATCSPNWPSASTSGCLPGPGRRCRSFVPLAATCGTMREQLTNDTKIQCALDAKERPMHCHHEKTIVIDDRVAFVGGIDLTSEAGDRYDTNEHPARADGGLARRLRENRRPRRRRRRRTLPHALARSHRRSTRPAASNRNGRRDRPPDRPHRPRTDLPRQPARRVPHPRVATSAPFDPRSGSSTSRTSSSGRPKSQPRSATSSPIRPPPTSGLSCCCPRSRTTAATTREASSAN